MPASMDQRQVPRLVQGSTSFLERQVGRAPACETQVKERSTINCKTDSLLKRSGNSSVDRVLRLRRSWKWTTRSAVLCLALRAGLCPSSPIVRPFPFERERVQPCPLQTSLCFQSRNPRRLHTTKNFPKMQGIALVEDYS